MLASGRRSVRPVRCGYPADFTGGQYLRLDLGLRWRVKEARVLVLTGLPWPGRAKA